MSNIKSSNWTHFSYRKTGSVDQTEELENSLKNRNPQKDEIVCSLCDGTDFNLWMKDLATGEEATKMDWKLHAIDWDAENPDSVGDLIASGKVVIIGFNRLCKQIWYLEHS